MEKLTLHFPNLTKFIRDIKDALFPPETDWKEVEKSITNLTNAIQSVKNSSDKKLAKLVEIYPDQNYSQIHAEELMAKFELQESSKSQIENIISHEVKIRWVQANSYE